MPEIGTSGSMSGDRKRGVAEWPSYRAILDSTIATNFSSAPDVSFWGEADLGRAAEFAASVENDRAARLAAIPAGASPANRGVQSLL